MIFFISCSEIERTRYIHFSVDDVRVSFVQITQDSLQYESLFQHPFFSFLKSLRDEFGCKITLYCYEQDGSYNISQFPKKYKDELDACSEWLKFGFHAVRPNQSKQEISELSCFINSFNNTNQSIEDFASKASLATALRLEFFYATKEEVEFLRGKGVTCLLSADDERISYSGEEYQYLKTDLRIERMNSPLYEYYRNINDDTLVIFTHERYLMEDVYQSKLKKLLRMLSNQQVKYLCL